MISQMNTRRNICAASAMFAPLIDLSATAVAPNFIFFITDDISPEHLSCYGGPVQMPNLERLAASGMLFQNAYVTTSSCSPSRCSILTSRYPHNTGAPELHMNLPGDQQKFPAMLRQNGYYSVLNGKNHMSPKGKAALEILGDAFDEIMEGAGPGGEEEWIDVLRNRPKNKPFFFWFASHDAHRNWQFNDKAPLFQPEDIEIPSYLFDGQETRKDFAGHYHEIARTDYYLGELLDELERQKIADNTYVIYCSDNGKPFPRCKTCLYDTGVKVPLIMAGPGIQAGTVSSSLVSTIDIGPTILELTNVLSPKEFQGVSFVPVLKDPSVSVRDYIFAEHNWHINPANERMVRYQNWVYIRNYRVEEQSLCATHFPAGKELWNAELRGELTPEQRNVFLKPRPLEELYCVDSDPCQFVNLIESPECASILNELRGVMDAWREATGDTVPENPTSSIGKINAQLRGEIPGESKNAAYILNPGPIKKQKL